MILRVGRRGSLPLDRHASADVACARASSPPFAEDSRRTSAFLPRPPGDVPEVEAAIASSSRDVILVSKLPKLKDGDRSDADVDSAVGDNPGRLLLEPMFNGLVDDENDGGDRDRAGAGSALLRPKLNRRGLGMAMGADEDGEEDARLASLGDVSTYPAAARS